METRGTSLRGRRVTYASHMGDGTTFLINAGPTVLLGVVGVNNNAAVLYGQFHNKATAPAATEVPTIVGRHAANGAQLSTGGFNLPLGGVLFPLGLGFAWSTTLATFTDAATAATLVVTVVYEVL